MPNAATTENILRDSFLTELEAVARRIKLDGIGIKQGTFDGLITDVRTGNLERADNTVDRIVRDDAGWFELSNLIAVAEKFGESSMIGIFHRRFSNHQQLLAVQREWSELAHLGGRPVAQVEDMARELLERTATDTCTFYEPWIGVCSKPSHGKYCAEHLEVRCYICGSQAFSKCSQTSYGRTCGNGLCGAHPCVHVGNTLSL